MTSAQRQSLTAGRADLGEALADAHRESVADLAIGVELLLAAAIGVGRIMRRPVFDVGRERARQVQRLVVGLRRERDDEVEIEPLPVFQLFERRWLVAGNVL